MNDLYVAYNLQENYYDLGEYNFKLVLNPKKFKHGRDCSVVCMNSDGNPMDCEVNIWGRKINFRFEVTESVPDGVSSIDLRLVDDFGKVHIRKLTFWIIKP